MTILNEVRNNFVTRNINNAIKELQEALKRYDGSESKLTLSITGYDEDCRDLVLRAICTYLDDNGYRDTYSITVVRTGFTIYFDAKCTLDGNELGLVYDEDNNYLGIFYYSQFVQREFLSPVARDRFDNMFRPNVFTIELTDKNKTYSYIFTPLTDKDVTGEKNNAL